MIIIKSILVLLAIVVFMIALGVYLTYKDINNSYICKSCRKVNQFRGNKCKYCKTNMGMKNTYRTLLFGKRNYKNSDGDYVRKKELRWLIIDTVICIIVEILLIVLAIKL